MKEYYDLRASEYDEWWHAATRERPGWANELDEAMAVVAALPPARTLDVACGTGYLTERLRGDVVGLDQSARMLGEARTRLPQTTFVRGDALALPFPDGAFGRVFTSYFYCHLLEEERARFLGEARRVAPELVVLGSRQGEGEERDRWEERRLSDGSTWPVFKRVFAPDALALELGGDVLHAGRWFVCVRA
ncbi:MAG TPA: class I SAM-dependent methyltransferase [Gaiellaceae bacterium]|nr:class I SAM-dependent methyltransferase [Gaiellaceae bacterium]